VRRFPLTRPAPGVGIQPRQFAQPALDPKIPERRRCKMQLDTMNTKKRHTRGQAAPNKEAAIDAGQESPSAEAAIVAFAERAYIQPAALNAKRAGQPHLIPVDHRDELADAALRLLARQLTSHQIAYVWPESHRVLFRTADGRDGDVQVFVNWNAASTESATDGSVMP